MIFILLLTSMHCTEWNSVRPLILTWKKNMLLQTKLLACIQKG